MAPSAAIPAAGRFVFTHTEPLAGLLASSRRPAAALQSILDKEDPMTHSRTIWIGVAVLLAVAAAAVILIVASGGGGGAGGGY